MMRRKTINDDVMETIRNVKLIVGHEVDLIRMADECLEEEKAIEVSKDLLQLCIIMVEKCKRLKEIPWMLEITVLKAILYIFTEVKTLRVGLFLKEEEASDFGFVSDRTISLIYNKKPLLNYKWADSGVEYEMKYKLLKAFEGSFVMLSNICTIKVIPSVIQCLIQHREVNIDIKELKANLEEVVRIIHNNFNDKEYKELKNELLKSIVDEINSHLQNFYKRNTSTMVPNINELIKTV